VNKTILELADFLITRIEADEDRARMREVSAIADIWESSGSLPHTRDAGSPLDPARVLIDCDVRLRMVRKARQAIEAADIVTETFGGDDVRARIDRALHVQASITWSTVLRYMGLLYAHHQDYQEVWKP
jgi:hypothetical protein